MIWVCPCWRPQSSSQVLQKPMDKTGDFRETPEDPKNADTSEESADADISEDMDDA